MCFKTYCAVSHVFDFCFAHQAFQETIEIFQQKNESFKNALKDVEEVSVSVVPELLQLLTGHNADTFLQRLTDYVFLCDYRRQSWESAPLAGFVTMK